MNVIITGSTGLAQCIGDVISKTPYVGTIHLVYHARIESILNDEIDWDGYDTFINCAHVDFQQSFLLMKAFTEWRDDKTKTIINISSRAANANISKGYMYSAQKAALNHLSNNLTWNSDKKCRITTMNLGLLNHPDIPSTSHNEVASWIYSHCTGSKHIDIPEITLQNSENYLQVQSDKQTLKDIETLNKRFYHLHT